MKTIALIVLTAIVAGGCTVVLSPQDDVVRRLGVLEEHARRVDAWSTATARQVSEASTALEKRLGALEQPKVEAEAEGAK